MQSKLNPYLSFKDNAREAMTFYQTVFGGKLDMQTFGEFGMPNVDPAEADKIMHAMLEADNGIIFMGADTPSHMDYKAPGGISMSLSGDNEAELRGYFDKLAAGGVVTLAMDKSPWGDLFGMCVDAFGVSWMVNITAASAPAVKQ